MNKNYGPCVTLRPRQDGTTKFRFEVRRDRPEGWPYSRPILVDGRDGVRLETLTPAQEVHIERTAEALFRQLGQMRAAQKAETQPERPTIERSWEQLIQLRREHSNWLGLKPKSRATYASTQKRINNLLGWDSALAPSTVLESQIDRVFQKRIDSLYLRKKAYQEVRQLLGKAVREGWRDPALTISYSAKLPKPKLKTWTAEDLRCAATQAITDGELGLARMIFAHWEIGQRLQDVRLFRYGYQYSNGAFSYRCQKTGREIRIRVSNETARRILDEGARHGAYMFPRSEDGKPFTGVELSKTFARLRKRLKGFDQTLQFRQIRHTVILELALAGCTVPEIATVTGHELSSVHQTLKHYLRPDSEMSDRAVEKRDRRRLENLMGMKGELIVEGVRCIFIGDLAKAETPLTPEQVAA